MENTNDLSAGANVVPVSTRSGQSKKPRRSYQSHGFTGQLRGRYTADRGQIDGRSALGRALAEWEGELIESLGGADSISPQERVLIEMCAKDYMLLSSIDAWLLRQPSLIHSKKRQVYPIVQQRAQLADSLTKRLQALGLKKKAKPTRTLSELLQKGEAA